MKKILAILLSLLMALSAFSGLSFIVSAEDDPDATSGELSDKISWTVDRGETKLTISGTGEMPELEDGVQPWMDQKDYIEYVVIDDGVTSICARAFAALPKLHYVEISETVEKIDGSAFADDPALIQFKVVSGNKYFLANDVNSTDGILYNIDKTEIVRFPAACTLITKSVTTFTLPGTVKKIGDYAFEGCTSVTGIGFEKDGQLEAIGDYAFADCTALKAFDCTRQPDLVAIGDYAFSGCTALTEFKIWNTLDSTKLGTDIFDGCETFSNFIFYGTKTQFGYLNIALPGSTVESGHFLNTDLMIKAYFIKYDPNGGTTEEKWDIVINGTDTTISTHTPVSTKGTFIGWSKDPNATTAVTNYAAGTKYLASSGSLYLYAVYSNVMTLTYDANGGSGAPQAVTFTKAGTLTVSTVTPSRAGYEFKGWSKLKNATSASFQPGDKISVDANVTLYAVWESTGPYDISYYDGTTLIATDTAAKTKNVDYTITRTASRGTDDRYEFLGWSTSNGGSVVYKAGDKYTNNDNLVLYAVFKDNGPYDVYVYYDSQNYNAVHKISQSSRGASVTIDISPVAYSEYEFLGWSTSNYSGTAEYQTGDSFVPEHDVYLYPCMKKINLTENATLSLTGKSITVNYMNRLCITAEADNLPEGYGIALFTEGAKTATVFSVADASGHASISYTTDPLTSSTEYMVKITKSGAAAGITYTNGSGKQLAAKINVGVNTNIFLKILAFFRNFLGGQPIVNV